MARNPNRMQEAVTTLMSRFQGYASIVIAYQQGTTTLTGIDATQYRTPYEIIQGGVVITCEVHDFVVSVADMQGLTPTSGDTITDAGGRKYIVSMPDKSNVYESFQGLALRIHTKAVS